MTATELLSQGQLRAALMQLNDEVRTHPTDTQRRTFLFELLCFTGEYQRASRHLDVLQHSANALGGVQVYQQVLLAEQARQRCVQADGLPHFLFAPPTYVQQHYAALQRLRAQRLEEATALLEQAGAACPTLHGQLNGHPFLSLRDGDDVLAPCLELFVQHEYVWLPWEQIVQITIPAPQHLRDLLWLPALVESVYGPIGQVFLPVLYPLSYTHVDEQVCLGRATAWHDYGAGLTLGAGQRMWFTDAQETSLLQVRQLQCQVAHA